VHIAWRQQVINIAALYTVHLQYKLAGYWAHCMRQRGIEVAAFDKYPPVTTDGRKRKPLANVQMGGPEVLATNKHRGKCEIVHTSPCRRITCTRCTAVVFSCQRPFASQRPGMHVVQ
jgi:hypothetical protein